MSNQVQSMVVAPPHSRNAEDAVIGSVFINQEVYRELYFLKPADFYIERNAWIWNTFGVLSFRNIPIDLLTVESELSDKGLLNEVGGPAYLTSLVNQVPSSLNAEAYGRRVEEFSRRRKLIAAANAVAECGYDLEMTIEKVTSLSLEAVYSAADRQSHKEVTIGAALYAAYDMSLEAKRTGKILGIPTGFVDLDGYLGGLKNGKLYYVGGRPGMGKTALVMDFAISAADKGKKVRIFSQEMNFVEIAIRYAAKKLKIDTKRIEEGALTDSQWQQYKALVDAAEDYERFPIVIDETVPLNPVTLNSICINQLMRENLDLIIVDYVQLLEGDGVGLREQITNISRSMKRLSRSLNLPVVGAAQLTRAAAEGKPGLKDLQETGALEQDADVVMLISPDEQSDLKQAGIMDIDIAKHRGGPTGTVYLKFVREYTKFESSTVKKQGFDE